MLRTIARPMIPMPTKPNVVFPGSSLAIAAWQTQLGRFCAEEGFFRAALQLIAAGNVNTALPSDNGTALNGDVAAYTFILNKVRFEVHDRRVRLLDFERCKVVMLR